MYRTVKSAEARREFAVSLDRASWPAEVAIADELGCTAVVVTVGPDEALGLTHAFHAKDRLKAAGWVWSPYYKTWFAPSREAFTAIH